MAAKPSIFASRRKTYSTKSVLYYNAHWPTSGEADSSLSGSVCHISGPIGVEFGKLALVFGNDKNTSRILVQFKQQTILKLNENLTFLL